MVRQRVRIRFRKQGDLRLIGHRDLARALARLFRRAGLSLARTEGFHPKPRMHFPSALALGIEGQDEVVELELVEPLSAEEIRARLEAHRTLGLAFHAVTVLPPGARRARLRSATYEVPIPDACRAELRARLEQLRAAPTWLVNRPHRRTPLELRALVEELAFNGDVLRVRLRAHEGASAGPRDVLAALGLEDVEASGAVLVRTQVELVP